MNPQSALGVSITEQEWLIGTDPTSMLNFVRPSSSERKLRLFSVACCRRVWHLIDDQRLQEAVEVAERIHASRGGRGSLRGITVSQHPEPPQELAR